MSDDEPTIRERIEALRPWPEGEPLIRALLAYEETVSSASPTPNLDAMREAERAARAAAPPVEPDCGAPSLAGGPCVLPKGHNIGMADIPENHIGHAPVPPPDPVAGLREALDPSWCGCDYEPVRGIAAGRHLPSCRYGVILDYLDTVPAALLGEPVPLDVERLARALTILDPQEVGWEDTQLIHVSTDATYEQSRREWAHAIAAEYARLTDPKGATDGGAE